MLYKESFGKSHTVTTWEVIFRDFNLMHLDIAKHLLDCRFLFTDLKKLKEQPARNLKPKNPPCCVPNERVFLNMVGIKKFSSR